MGSGGRMQRCGRSCSRPTTGCRPAPRRPSRATTSLSAAWAWPITAASAPRPSCGMPSPASRHAKLSAHHFLTLYEVLVKCICRYGPHRMRAICGVLKCWNPIFLAIPFSLQIEDNADTSLLCMKRVCWCCADHARGCKCWHWRPLWL